MRDSFSYFSRLAVLQNSENTMSSDRIDTPDAPPSDPKESPDNVIIKTVLNASAEEFRPGMIKQKLQFRPDAPEFIPERIRIQVKPDEPLYCEVSEIVCAAGVAGILVRDIPKAYMSKYSKNLDLTKTSSSDLSVLLKEIGQVSIVEAAKSSESMRKALIDAGFSEISSPNSSLVMGCENFFARAEFGCGEVGGVCPLGADSEQVAVDQSVSKFVQELRTFKDTLVEVACKNPSGVLISQFASEWDKSFLAKGLVGMPDLAALTDRFHVVDFVAFLQAIPSLELVASVEMDDYVVRLRSPLNPCTGVVVLDDELFGADRSDSPVTVGVATEVSALKGMKQHISPLLASQLLSQVEKQVLELGSHLAKKGLQSSSNDLMLIRLQLQQLQSLKTSLQAVMTPLPPPNAIPPQSAAKPQQPSAYASLLSQAAQFAMSAISANKDSKKAPAASTAATSAVSSRKSSPSSSLELSKDDLKSLIIRVVEKSSGPTISGIAVSSVKSEWARMFPALEPLDTYLGQHEFKDVQSLLLSEKNLVVFYATLPSPQLRVALKRLFDVSNQSNVSVTASPLISPCSMNSYTSDLQKPEDLLQRKLTELLLKHIRKQQGDAVRARARSGDSAFAALANVLDVVESQKSASGRLLDSKRPPPIDTGSSSSAGAASLSGMVKQFVSVSSDVLISKAAIVGINIADIPALWQKEFKAEFPASTEEIAKVKGVRVLGTKCTLTALSNPGAIVACLFCLNDAAVWSSSNSKLVEAVKRVIDKQQQRKVVTHEQLSELSSVLFKSIMAGGPKTAKDCAGALKLLASKDPKAIHEIVSSHIVSLQQTNPSSEEAASAFVNTLVEKGKQLKKKKESSTSSTSLEKLMAQLKQKVQEPPPGLNSCGSPFPEKLDPVYANETLVEIREKMEKLGQLTEAPDGIKNVRIPSRRK